MRIAIDANVLERRLGRHPQVPEPDRRGADRRRRRDRPARQHAPARAHRARRARGRRPGQGDDRSGARPSCRSGWPRARADVLWAPESVLPRWSPVPTVATIHDLASLRFPGIKPERPRGAVRDDGGALGAAARPGRSPSRRPPPPTSSASTASAPTGSASSPTASTTASRPATARRRWRRCASAGASRRRSSSTSARIEPRKGIDVLVEAAALAPREGAGWRVVLAGSSGFAGRADRGRGAGQRRLRPARPGQRRASCSTCCAPPAPSPPRPSTRASASPPWRRWPAAPRP